MTARRARRKAPSTASPSIGTRRRWTSGANHGCIEEASPPSRATREAPHSDRRRTNSSICSAASRTIRARDRISGVRMPHHQGREGRIVRGRRAIHPGNGLERIVVEACHHVARETGADGALVIGPQRQADCVQPEIGSAALVGYGKAIAANSDLASSDNGKADAARSDDDDAAISGAMRPDTCDRRVMSVNDGAEGMRPQHELFQRTFAADSGKPDAQHASRLAHRSQVRLPRSQPCKPSRLRQARGRVPRRSAAGPAMPVPSKRPSASSMRARQPVPPPSTPTNSGAGCEAAVIRDPLDIRTALHELAVERFISAIEMVDAVDCSFRLPRPRRREPGSPMPASQWPSPPRHAAARRHVPAPSNLEARCWRRAVRARARA